MKLLDDEYTEELKKAFYRPVNNEDPPSIFWDPTYYEDRTTFETKDPSVFAGSIFAAVADDSNTWAARLELDRNSGADHDGEPAIGWHLKTKDKPIDYRRRGITNILQGVAFEKVNKMDNRPNHLVFDIDSSEIMEEVARKRGMKKVLSNKWTGLLAPQMVGDFDDQRSRYRHTLRLKQQGKAIMRKNLHYNAITTATELFTNEVVKTGLHRAVGALRGND